MTWKNTTDTWGRTARGLHWVTALLLTGQYALGWIGPGMSPTPLKIDVMTGHKSLGITILLLFLTRLLWRHVSPAPKPAAGLGRWARRLSAAVHASIYAAGCMLALSGWLAASTTLVPWKLWWLLPWPRLAAPDKALHETFATGHEWLSWVLLLLIAGHILAALRHHFVEGNEVLKRMWGGSLLAGMLLIFSTVAGAQSWSSMPGAGELAFTARYESQELAGLFTTFSVRVEQSGRQITLLTVTVDTASADMNDAEVNAALAAGEWFDSGMYPEAVFESREILFLGGQAYAARGELTLKGQPRAIEVPFRWQEGAAGATLAGALELSRTNWGVGTGDWANTSTIADAVEVRFEVQLQAVN